MEFSKYFSSWLYDEDGYYSKAVKIGKQGDFYTSLSVGSLFGITIAKHFLNKIDFYDKKELIDIVEIGANEAYFLSDFIQGIFTLEPKLLKRLRFNIIEPRKNLRKLQSFNLEQNFGKQIEFRHFSSLKDFKSKAAFFMANELFDSFACEVIDEDKMLYIKEDKAIFDEAKKAVKKLAIEQNVSKGEVILGLDEFIKDLYDSAQKAIFLTFDYGFYEKANRFSLRVYKNHQVYDFFELEDLSEFYKISDITYNLNFKALEQSFIKNGFEVMMKYRVQNEVLIDFGILQILELLQEKGGEKAYQNGLKQFKYLVLPAFLGEKFKAMEFYKK